ncbi:MAG: hypothetical protein ABI306_03035 [Caulobacteraceae bacterium]
MAAIVTYGFSQTIGDNLIHPKIARPWLLYVHAALFCAWLTLYVLQSGLVRAGNVKLHRRLGLAWLCLGAAMPIVGVATAVVMRRFDIVHLHDTLPFLVIPLWDVGSFTVCFGLAAIWRKRPEFHRRLMFLATCALIGAGLGRFPVPEAWFNAGWFYFVIDAMVLVAIGRDLIVQRRVHPVFAVALPLMVVGQIVAWTLWWYPPAPWLGFLRVLVGAG